MPRRPAIDHDTQHLVTNASANWLENSSTLLLASPSTLAHLNLWTQGMTSTDTEQVRACWDKWVNPGKDILLPYGFQAKARLMWCQGAAAANNPVALQCAIDAGFLPWRQPDPSLSRRDNWLHWPPTSSMGWIESLLNSGQQGLVEKLTGEWTNGTTRAAATSLGLARQEASLFALALRHGCWKLAARWMPSAKHPQAKQACREGLWGLCLYASGTCSRNPKIEQWAKKLQARGVQWTDSLDFGPGMKEITTTDDMERMLARMAGRESPFEPDGMQGGGTMATPLRAALAAVSTPSSSPAMAVLWESAAKAIPDDSTRPSWPLLMHDPDADSNPWPAAYQAWAKTLWMEQSVEQRAQESLPYWKLLTKAVAEGQHPLSSLDIWSQWQSEDQASPRLQWGEARQLWQAYAARQSDTEDWPLVLECLGRGLAHELQEAWRCASSALMDACDNAPSGPTYEAYMALHLDSFPTTASPLQSSPPRPRV